MKQAVILAAGEGQRLRPFTVTRPKVMLRIAGKPILQYVIDSLAQNGIREHHYRGWLPERTDIRPLW